MRAAAKRRLAGRLAATSALVSEVFVEVGHECGFEQPAVDGEGGVKARQAGGQDGLLKDDEAREEVHDGKDEARHGAGDAEEAAQRERPASRGSEKGARAAGQGRTR